MQRDKVAYKLQDTLKALGIEKAAFHAFRHNLPFLTMSSDIGQQPVRVGIFRSKRGCGERIAQHSLLDPTGC